MNIHTPSGATLFCVALCFGAVHAADTTYTGPSHGLYMHFKQSPIDLVFMTQEMDEILRLKPNGDLLWRGRQVTNDAELVNALRDVVSGRTCR